MHFVLGCSWYVTRIADKLSNERTFKKRVYPNFWNSFGEVNLRECCLLHNIFCLGASLSKTVPIYKILFQSTSCRSINNTIETIPVKKLEKLFKLWLLQVWRRTFWLIQSFPWVCPFQIRPLLLGETAQIDRIFMLRYLWASLAIYGDANIQNAIQFIVNMSVQCRM